MEEKTNKGASERYGMFWDELKVHVEFSRSQDVWSEQFREL